ncbi:larval cuticle protein A3A-like [Bicyclus anynana]|uniref:Larval cuticle protein A3A-like n=1 Tax=Bicyclus anynana TaxID=110368 RepID=A0A6J1PAC4_BICAN|nr:larval cuticle protein A3A-like [Bicyclus anynana]
MFSFVAIACLFGAAAAAPSGYGGLGVVAVDSYAVPRYEFNYAVNDPSTGDNKAQSEVRDGDAVKGSYSLTEPDGTLRVVEYTADAARGFNAIVKRIGGAAHPQTLQLAPVVAKQIVTAPVVEEIAAPIIAPVAKIAEPVYSAGLINGGWGNAWGNSWGNNLGKGWGLGSWDLGNLGDLGLGLSLGHGGWKH